MKITKKILAAFIVVMMIAMMIPLTASAAENYSVGVVPFVPPLSATNAAENYSVNVTGKAGYEATAYKIADIDTTTGAYSNYAQGLSADDFAIPAGKTSVDSAALLAKCEGLTTLPSAAEVLAFTEGATTKTFSTAKAGAGVYYFKITKVTEGTKKAGGAIVSLPQYKNGSWSNPDDVTLKIEDGDVNVTKKIVEGESRVDETTANIGDTITFELKASVVGSLDEPITEYTIHDNLSDKFSSPAVTKVTIDGEELATSNYTVNTNDQSDITMSINKAYLDDAKNNGFYTKANVIVTLTAVLNENAVIGAQTKDNKNSDSLTYTNKFGQTTKPGNEVYVHTFDVNVIKVDANDTTKVLANAGFTLYVDSACTTVAKNGAEKFTNNKGIATFTGIKDGTYYLKETTAPAGYTLNATIFKVVISKTGEVSVTGTDIVDGKIQVKDSPIVVPATGGMGTMVFTIVGASLIACAGILLVVLKRKKASK